MASLLFVFVSIFTQQQQQQQVYLQVKYSLHIKLVPAISEGYLRRAQEKKGKFHNRYMYIKRAILEAI